MNPVEITTYTGSEWHTSYGAKGHVFVVDLETKRETPIYESSIAKLVDQDWYDVQGGKHGKWCEATYQVPEGTILKLFAISTWRGRPNGGGGAYLRIDASQPTATAEGDGYGERAGSVTGQMVMLSLDEIVQLGITIPAEYKRYYRNNGVSLTVKEQENVSN